jgi:dynein light intermediate chain
VHCSDEIIRQVTINCAERGLLLLRVRDEVPSIPFTHSSPLKISIADIICVCFNQIRMTIASYQTLYESSIAYGMRKALAAEQGKAQMQAKVKTYQTENRDLERQIAEMEAKIESMQVRDRAAREDANRRHQDEVEALRQHNQTLRDELETLLSIPVAAPPAAAKK